MKKILDKIPRPPGAIPARAQTWLLLCLTAAIAVTLVSFPGDADTTSTEDSAEAVAAASSGASSGVGVTSVESAARRMRAEAARKAERRMQAELGVPAPRPDGLPHPPQPVHVASSPEHGQGDVYSPGPTAEEEIEREERIRRYRSLRAPSLVQSVRAAPARTSDSSAPAPREGEAETVSEPSTVLPDAPDPAPVDSSESQPEDKTGTSPFAKTHVLREGEFLEAVLTNRLSGDFIGPVNAMVSADAYDRRRQHLLVPRGTRALGAASRIEDWEQSRLAVVFRRLILPDGTAISLGESAGLNQIGETGLRDLVDRRYLSTFAAAGAVGALAGLSQAVSPQDAFSSRLGSARISAGAGLSRSAERVLDRYLNRLPRVTVREGHRIRIYLTQDLTIPAYDDPRD